MLRLDLVELEEEEEEDEDEDEDEEEEEEEEEEELREASSRRITTSRRDDEEEKEEEEHTGGALSGSAIGAGELGTIPGVDVEWEAAAARTFEPSLKESSSSLSPLSAEDSLFLSPVLLAFLRSRCLRRCLDPLDVPEDPRWGVSFDALLIALRLPARKGLLLLIAGLQ